MQIGVISDTHNFLDPHIPRLFAGVDHILHAGDIGLPKILLDLERVAPVTAVMGNTDDPGFGYRLMEFVELGGRKFLLHHIVEPRRPGEMLRERIRRENPAAVVFGHSHKPFSEIIEGRFYFNPGYAGKQRWNLPRSVAILHCDEAGIRPEFLPL